MNEIQWIFSGIGVFLLSLFIKKQYLKKKTIKQKIGNKSTGIQVGRDLNVGGNINDSKSGE